jgi:hypothetical protein
MPPAALSDAVRGFFVQPVEHQGTLAVGPTGLISARSIFGTGRIFPLALNFFDASYHGVH